MFDIANFRGRLRQLMDERGVKQKPLSDQAGLKETAVRDILRGKSLKPSIETIQGIANALDVTVSHLLGEDVFTAATFPSIPRYDIRLSAGAGSVNYEDAEILDHIPFTDEFLTRKLNRSNTDGLICCDVHGDSMAPTLNDGDLVILDVQQVRDRRPAGIYAATYGKESFVKRVEKVDTGYTLFSDNPAYETIRIRGDEVSKLHFVGKVIWSGGVMR